MSGALRAFMIGLTAFLTGGRPVRDAGHPALAHRVLRREPGSDGLRRQCQHDRHGYRRSRRRPVRALDRPKARHPVRASRSCRCRRCCSATMPPLPVFTALRIGARPLACRPPLRSPSPISASTPARPIPRAPSRPISPATSPPTWLAGLLAAGVVDHLGLSANFCRASPRSISAAPCWFGSPSSARRRWQRDGREPRLAGHELAAFISPVRRCARPSLIGLRSCFASSAPLPTSTSC